MSPARSTPAPLRVPVRVGLLGGAAAMLFVLESLVPRPLPWMRLGLGNLPVLTGLLLHGTPAALGVSVVKLLLGGLLGGGLGGPAFVLAVAGGLSSVLAMGGVCRLAPRLFSPVGVSIVGATAHQLVQLALASAYIAHAALWSLLPLFLLTGLVGGGLIGVLSVWILRRLGQDGSYP